MVQIISNKNEIKDSIINNQALLIDFDGTLVNYLDNVTDSLDIFFKKYNLPSEKYNEVTACYNDLNTYYWGLFEQKKISIKEVQIKRFEDLQKKYPEFDSLPEKLNEEFLDAFVLSTKIEDKVKEALLSLKKMGITLVIITNGVHWTQTERFKNIGLNEIIDTYFTSESVGHAKPHPEMFDRSINYAKQKLNSNLINNKNLWVIGDSYEADMKGAFKLGLKTCWIANGNQLNPGDKKPNLIVNDFIEFYDFYNEIKEKNK